ncbi:MBL fold metallo-hydrolase [Halomicroarcula sp. GCM10025709]|uniref:MBL fold metallo-hydrolase n=1 Tax=Halomicroarcula sp. GCM10025709 TaxID=3252669 RepID=UPI00361F22E9
MGRAGACSRSLISTSRSGRRADGRGFTVYHTPGHNPGHVVYHHDATSTMFLGDLVWGEDGGLTTPFWGDSYDMAQLRESVGDLARTVPEFDVAAMGHGTPVTTDGGGALRRLAASV